jgi:beta-glucanase (GH16 family)
MMRGPKFAAPVGMLVAAVTLALLGAVVSAEAAAPETPPPTSDACGSMLAKSDGTPWTCTFVDDFSGTALDRSKWVVQTDMPAGSATSLGCHTDSPNNVSVSGGSLRLTVRKAAAPFVCGGLPATYTSGQVSTFYKWSQQYGRFEARMKVPAATTPGLHEAFWLWPDARVASTTYWPAAGEIDISETYSMYPDLTVPFLHYTYTDNGGAIPGLNTAWDCSSPRGVWNTYTLIWTATRIEIRVNGTTCLVNTSGDPAFRKAYILVLTQALGVAENGFTGLAPLPATTEVDYVKVWK